MRLCKQRHRRGKGPKRPDFLLLSGAFEVDEGEPVEVVAAEGEDGGALPTFKGLAYSGGLLVGMPTSPGLPVVCDLSTFKVPARLPAVLREHDPRAIVGHLTKTDNNGRRLRVEGTFSGVGADAAEVLGLGQNKFPWQLSIRAPMDEAEYVGEGDKVTANGRTFKGPLLYARKGFLRECSFVAFGADKAAWAEIAAHAVLSDFSDKGADEMNFEQWLRQRFGELVATWTPEQKAAVWASYAAEVVAAGGDPGQPPEGATPLPEVQQVQVPVPAVPVQANEETEPVAPGLRLPANLQDLIAQSVASGVAGELARQQEIAERCGGDQEIIAQARANNWTADRAELESLRRRRPDGPYVAIAGNHRPTRIVLEAAVRMMAGERQSHLEEDYEANILEQAHPLRSASLKELVATCCAMDGQPAPRIGCSQQELIATFSTISLPGILGDSAHKAMLAAYRAVSSAAKIVAAKLTATDFKTHTGYKFGGDTILKELSPTGQMDHADLSEQSFPYSVATYARYFALTRVDAKNDDLQAFMSVPRMIGRGAAQRLELMFWTLVLANTGNFFHADNSNYFEGATTALSSESLATAVGMLRKMNDDHGVPIGVEPKFLVVPSELEATASELYVSRLVTTGGGSSKNRQPTDNIHANKYQPVQTPYMSNSSITGYSTTAWLLLADPEDCAAFGVCYLDGVEEPTVEQVDLAGDVLGTGYRGYIDLGVCQMDKRGGVKSKGAA